MSDSSERPVQGEAFWKEHVLTAATFMGSDQEYCRRNGLNPATFSTYKVKLGFSKHKKPRAKAFVKIEPKLSEGSGERPTSEFKSRLIPDPKWTAEFVSALFLRK